MKLECVWSQKSKNNFRRKLVIEGWSSDKSTILNMLLKAGAAALLPVVLKLIVLAGQQLLTAAAN